VLFHVQVEFSVGRKASFLGHLSKFGSNTTALSRFFFEIEHHPILKTNG
jgi:hypothetical protein